MTTYCNSLEQQIWVSTESFKKSNSKAVIYSGNFIKKSLNHLLNRFVQQSWFIQERNTASFSLFATIFVCEATYYLKYTVSSHNCGVLSCVYGRKYILPLSYVQLWLVTFCTCTVEISYAKYNGQCRCRAHNNPLHTELHKNNDVTANLRTHENGRFDACDPIDALMSQSAFTEVALPFLKMTIGGAELESDLSPSNLHSHCWGQGRA